MADSEVNDNLNFFDITVYSKSPTTRFINRNIATMGVPFEALIPYGIMLAMFGVTGVGLSTAKYIANGNKPHRYCIDKWDRQMIERDRRMTGYTRGQLDDVKAPKGFELNRPWKIEPQTL